MFKISSIRLHGLRQGMMVSGDKHARLVTSWALAVIVAAALTIVSQPSPARASALPSTWRLVFDSNFAGTAVNGKPNPKVWTSCFPWANPARGCTDSGNGGADLEWYLPSQVHVNSGVLSLTATRKATTGYDAKGRPVKYSCRSGLVTTYKGFRFKYGFVQVTARLPFRTGLWPAFWLAAANLKWPPEIDILEHWGAQPVSKLYLHPLNGPRQGAVYNAPTAGTGWHTWRIMWTRTRLTWYYDNEQVYTTTTNVPQQAMYFIADLADTSNPVANTTSPAGPCNGTLLVKSVKVWQP
jgi:beta-glucanase (GH16 family)